MEDDITDICSKVTDTDEKIKATVKTIRDKIRKTYAVKDYNKVRKDGHFPVATRNLTTLVSDSYSPLEGAPLHSMILLRKTISNILIETKAIELFCVIYKYYVKDDWKFEGVYANDPDNSKLAHFYYSLRILQNYSDASDEFALYIAKYPGLLDAIRYVLVEGKKAHLKRQMKQFAAEVLEGSLAVSYNISMRDANVTIVRALDFTSTVQPYLESPEQLIKLIALATLASIVDEKESEIINANRLSVEMLLQNLEKGLKEPLRRHEGWSCKEAAFVVRMLARNDGNKKMLSDLGAVEILVKVGQTGNEDEIYEVIHALWALAFDPDIRKMMVKNELIGLVELLQKIQDSNHTPAIKQACSGALWTIREDLKSSTNENYKQLGHLQDRGYTKQDFKPKSKAGGKLESQEGTKQKHIMISYQWADQKMLIQVRDRLKANGFTVWMDIDQMVGSTIQAMADAVENADIFLMAMSHKYKDSPNCRAEAEYAFTKHKKIIPLKMENGYNADGWLGFILGSKLYYEFNENYPFENKMGELLKEINMFKVQCEKPEDQVMPTKDQEVTRDTVDSAQVFRPVTVHVPISKTTISKIREWKPSDVEDWINRNDLNSCGVSNLTAGEVALLLTMWQKAPEFFFKCLQSMLNVNDLLNMSKIVWALNDIVE